MRDALKRLPEIALNWSNNLAEEWEKSKQSGTVYGGETFTLSDDAKKYAAECLANVFKIQQAEASRLLGGESK